MLKLYWWEKLGRAGRNADGVRDHKVQAERHKAEIELVRLRGEHRYLEERDTYLQDEIRSIGKPEAWARHRAREGKVWLILFFLAVAITVGATLWALQYAEMGWVKQAIIALGVIAIPIVATEIFIGSLKELTESQDFRKTLVVISLLALLAGLVASGLLAASRGFGTSLASGSSQVEVAQVDSSQDLAARSQQLDRVKRTTFIMDIIMVITIICLAFAGDLVVGLSFFMARQHLGPAGTLLRLHKELAKVRRNLVKNEEDQEAARRRPEILYEELSAGALYIEAQKEERVPAETPKIAETKSGVPEVTKSPSVWTLMRKTAVVFFVVIALVAGLMTWALAADTVVVGVDLTTSSQVESEFKDSLDKVEEIIKSQKSPGTRVVVLAIRKDSFGSPIIFDDVVPLESGRFGQRLEAWRLIAIKKWRTRKASLNPGENGSDIFGFLMRAAVIFSDDPNGKKLLLVFSDMRHVGQGYNFEVAKGLAKVHIDELDAQGLLPKLQGVKVWILGAHTNGLSPAHWMKLKDFWCEYLKRSGAELMIFSPSRRFQEDTNERQ
jgi:hypothetical protein